MSAAPDQPPPGEGGHTPPASFLPFAMLGGRYVAEAVSLHGLSGTVPLQRLIGRRTIAGHHGLLYSGLPYQHGGGEFGSHYTFIWPQGRWRYAASLHSWKPHPASLGVLTALIASLAPSTSSVN